MPIIIFKGLKIEQLQSISTQLISDLSSITNTPRDFFTLECPQSVFVFDAAIIDMYPLVEIKWFDRDKAVQDLVALNISNHITQLGYKNVEVYFTTLYAKKYYENGHPFE